MIKIFKASFDQDWLKFFDCLDNSVKERIAKKIKRILLFPEKRHLGKRANFFVDEIGQYRITFRVFPESREVRFYFVGRHKDYEKWFKQFF